MAGGIDHLDQKLLELESLQLLLSESLIWISEALDRPGADSRAVRALHGCSELAWRIQAEIGALSREVDEAAHQPEPLRMKKLFK